MNIIKLGITLLIISLLSGASLSLVYKNTKDKIERVKKQKIYDLQKRNKLK